MNKTKIFLLFGIFFSINLFSQKKGKSFSMLSGPEKWWVLGHPFKAKRAWNTSTRTLHITDSLKNTNSIGSDSNGGQLDAFKHAFWMASLTHKIGSKSALKLGKAHEKGNYKTFLKGESEDGVLPDKVSSDMDLYNNETGEYLASKNLGVSELQLINLIIDHLKKGDLRIIKKDKELYLSCSGDPIETASLIGKWNNNKCLIPSNDP